MHTNALGSFNISQIRVGMPTMVKLWTDAPVDSQLAERWLREHCKGEVVDVTVLEKSILLELDPAVYTESEARDATRHFLQRVETAAAELDEFDLLRFKTSVRNMRDAMADPADASTDEPSLNYR